MATRLVMRANDGTTRAIDLEPGPAGVIIGRLAEHAEIVIPDAQVSRAHCRLRPSEEGWVVEDLGSRNGTWLNGQRVQRAVVMPGDRLRIGSCVLHLEAAEDPDPLLGAQIAGYAFESLIGRGRFGAVYRGLQLALRRPVALKVLSPEQARNPERVRAFLAEARRMGALNHPHVVQVHDIVTAGEHYFIVMELMAGSLGEVLDREGALPEARVRAVLHHIAQALAYAASQRLVHRDVKPDNILFDEAGTYKLADLGIAETIAADGKAHQQRIVGSPLYVAPEQAAGQALDVRADLYALGATAFHLLAGRPVFEGSPSELVQAHLHRPAPDVRSVARGVSLGMAQIVARLLRKRPEERYASAEELLRALERLEHPRLPLRRTGASGVLGPRHRRR
ncbi:MAG: serine/threonine-protein kinase [Planctomycetota bacterium]|nr:serine/threonine-protein kinase [Planctomycetota bacterium]